MTPELMEEGAQRLAKRDAGSRSGNTESGGRAAGDLETLQHFPQHGDLTCIDREPDGPSDEDADHLAEERRVADRLLGLDQRVGEAFERRGQALRRLEPLHDPKREPPGHFEEHVVESRKVRVEVRSRHPGCPRDVRHAGAFEAHATEFVHGCCIEALASGGASHGRTCVEAKP